MGQIGWFLAVVYNLMVLSVFKILNPHLSQVQPIAYLIFAFIAVSVFLFLWQDLKKNKERKPWQFEPSKLMDFLSFGSLVLFLFLGSYFASGQIVDPKAASYVNSTAVKIVHIWTVIYTIAFLVYRFWVKKKEITA